MFMPTQFIKDVMLPATNAVDDGLDLTYGEFLRWIGLWLVMSCHTVSDRNSWFETDDPNIFGDAPFRLAQYMSRNRFRRILNALRYTDEHSPDFTDKFWEMRGFMKAWNENMTEHFTAGLISCLDESISVWTQQFTCPGWMFIPRKPHPFGNEYHTICCCSSGIMYFMEIVEGKDRPPALGEKDGQHMGKTVGLVLRMTEPLHYTGKIVVMDSGFCVLRGLLEMEKKGVYGHALVKKRRYWPTHVDGDAINAHFADKDVGTTDGMNVTWEGRKLMLFGMKEPEYVSIIMSTYGSLKEVHAGSTTREYKNGQGQKVRKTLKYTEPYYNHYKKLGAVDTHNSRRHQPISIEETWGTKRWEHRAFAYHLAVAEVNSLFAYAHFVTKSPPMATLSYRKLLAKLLIDNPYLESEASTGDDSAPESERKRRRTRAAFQHQLERPPKFTGRWSKGAWTKSTVMYLQQECSGVIDGSRCRKRTRTFCVCDKSVFYCATCFVRHQMEVQ